MPKKELKPPSLDEHIRLMSGFLKESDRGYALIMAAWLDDALCEAIRGRFIDHTASADELLVGDSPLATFSSRIKIAVCLGLIDDRVKRDLNIIRAIRNEFAHQRGDLSFESPTVMSRCGSLGLLDEIRSPDEKSKVITPRNRFMLVASHLLMYLIEIANEIVRPQIDPVTSLNGYFAKRRALEPKVNQLLKWVRTKVAKDKEKSNK